MLEQLEERFLDLPGVQQLVLPSADRHDDIFGLWSRDGSHVRLILKIETALSESQRSALNKNIYKALEEFPELEPLRAGSFVTTQEVASAVEQETQRVIPWIILALFTLLLALLKSLRMTFVVLGSTLLALASTILAFSVLGYLLGPVSQLAPPFLLAVGSSFHLHYVSRLLNTVEEERKAVIRELRAGIALAAGTTACSLLTLIFLDVADVSRFAVLASAGTILAALYALFLQPLLLPERQPGVPRADVISGAYLKLFHPATVVLALLIAFVFSLGIKNLEVHTDPIRFLPEGHVALSQINRSNQLFPGNHFLSVLLLQRNREVGPQQIDFLHALEQQIVELPGVHQLITPLDFDSKLSQKASLREFLDDFSLSESLIPANFLSADQFDMRLLIETRLEGRDLLNLAGSIREILNSAAVDKQYQVGITSLELILAEQTAKIVHGLLESLSLTVSVVFILLLLIFKNLKIAIIGLVPNLLPLVSVFGLLGFYSSELDFGSCLVASAALGIAVDNTFHFLLCWRKKKMELHSSNAASRSTIRLTAYPFSITSLSLIGAFSMMILAHSLPVAHFGMLLAVTLLVGLVADLVVLPVLLAFTSD